MVISGTGPSTAGVGSMGSRWFSTYRRDMETYLLHVSLISCGSVTICLMMMLYPMSSVLRCLVWLAYR